MLAGEGLVEARTSGGFHLPSIDEPGLEDLYAWAGEVAALAIRAWPRGKPPPVGRADPALRRSPADWAAAMFDTVGRRSANAEHGRATGLINGRLHPVRTGESQVIDDVQIGRESCWDRVCQSVSVSGGAGDIKKK